MEILSVPYVHVECPQSLEEVIASPATWVQMIVDAIWVLVTELVSSTRVVNALTDWFIVLAMLCNVSMITLTWVDLRRYQTMFWGHKELNWREWLFEK